ncbi:MAG: hypothetical protein JSV44_00860, partial [Candidatus Zixiibacteriota bacterium]
VGTTLYCLLTGELPFKGDNEFAIRDAKLFNDPPRPRDLIPEIPRELEEVVLKAIDRNPEKRFASANEMQQRIDAIRAEIPRTAAVEETEPTRRPTGKSRKPLISGIVAAAIVIAVAILGWQFFGGRDGIVPPLLSSPSNGAILETALPTLSWEASLRAGGSYRLEYAADPEFLTLEIVSRLPENTYTLEAPLDSGTYFWRVEAVDPEGNSSGYSDIYAFTLHPPAAGPIEGYVWITSNLASDFYIDDMLVESQAKNSVYALDTGGHIVLAKNPQSNEKTMQKAVTISAGDTASLAFAFTRQREELEPEPKPAQKPDSGIIRVATPSYLNALIYIDGKKQEKLTPAIFTLKEGIYVIRVELTIDGILKSKEETIRVAAGQDEIIKFSFDN